MLVVVSDVFVAAAVLLVVVVVVVVFVIAVVVGVSVVLLFAPGNEAGPILLFCSQKKHDVAPQRLQNVFP